MTIYQDHIEKMEKALQWYRSVRVRRLCGSAG